MAQAGEAQGEMAFTVGPGDRVAVGERGDPLPFDPAAVVQQVRNPLQPAAAGAWLVENGRYRATFDPTGFDLSLKEDDAPPAGEVRLAFRLLEIEAGGEVIYRPPAHPAPPQIAHNEARYPRLAGLVESYLAYNHGLQQQFTLEQPFAQGGDLVIRGMLETSLQPELTSDEDGLLF